AATMAARAKCRIDFRKITNLCRGEQPQRFCLEHAAGTLAANPPPQATVEDHMSKKSNSPTAIRVPKKRLDGTEIRSLTLDEFDLVTGGSLTLNSSKVIFPYTQRAD